jgi:hypothetical protein
MTWKQGSLYVGRLSQPGSHLGALHLALLLLAAQRVPAQQVDDQSIELLN